MQVRNQFKTYADTLSNATTERSNDTSEIIEEITNNYNKKGNNDELYYLSISTGNTNENKLRRITTQKIIKHSIKIDSTTIIQKQNTKNKTRTEKKISIAQSDHKNPNLTESSVIKNLKNKFTDINYILIIIH